MVDFVGPEVGIMPHMTRAANYWGAVRERGHNEWVQNEARRAYSREQDRLRDDASSFQRMLDQQQGAGLFDSQDSMLGGVSQQGVAPLRQPTAPAPTTPGGAPATSAQQPAPQVGLDTMRAQMREQKGPPGRPQGPSTLTPMNLESRVRNSTQRALVDQYNNVLSAYRRSGSNSRGGMNLSALSNTLDRMVQANLITNEERISEFNRANAALAFDDPTKRGTGAGGQPIVVDPPTDAPSAVVPIPPRSTAPPQAGVPGITRPGVTPPEYGTEQPAPSYQGGVEPPDAPRASNEEQDPWFQGVNDTSAPLVLTPEMELTNAAVQNALRQAEVNARHGRADLAEVSYAQALTGQASMLQQANMVLYRAGAGGSLNALELLIGRAAGYAPGTFRIAPTDERGTRFVGQRLIRDPATGQQRWVSASTTPWDRQTLLNSAFNIANAEGAAALSEAAAERYRAEVAANAQIRVAQINAGASLNDNYTDISVAQIGAAGRAAIASGEARLEELSNGDAILMWRQYNPRTGQMEQEFRQLDSREQQRLSTDGNETEEVLVASPVTGIRNVRPGG